MPAISAPRRYPRIDWAPDVYAAIERATAEDRPILLLTHVRENGDPACDV